MHLSIALLAIVGFASAGHLGRFNNRPLSQFRQGHGFPTVPFESPDLLEKPFKSHRFKRHIDWDFGKMVWDSFIATAKMSPDGMHAAWMKFMEGYASQTRDLWNDFLRLNDFKEEELLGQLNSDDLMTPPDWFIMWMRHMEYHGVNPFPRRFI